MVYLEYNTVTGEVVEIHENEPLVDGEYSYAITEEFVVGDEFEKSIKVNEVDENKILLSFSAIRNNPNAKRLLMENQQLKEINEELRLEMAQSNTELFEMMIAMSGGIA